MSVWIINHAEGHNEKGTKMFKLLKGGITGMDRAALILEKCGVLLYCSECKEPFGDESESEEIDENGIYRYTCEKCGHKSVFQFGLGPVPVLLDGEDIGEIDDSEFGNK